MLNNNIEKTLKELTISAIASIVKENDTLDKLLGVISTLAFTRESISFVQFEQTFQSEDGYLITELKLSNNFLIEAINLSNKLPNGMRLNLLSWQFMQPITKFSDANPIDIIDFLSSSTIYVDLESVDKVVLNEYLLEVLSLIPNGDEEENEYDD